MFIPFVLSVLLHLSVSNSQAVDQYGISLYDKMEVMERILLSPITSQNHLIAATVNPCTAFAGSPALGEQSSAEWVRIIFHDFITADVAAGTGFVFCLRFWYCYLTESVVWMRPLVSNLTVRRMLESIL
jgi:hypothetical protein